MKNQIEIMFLPWIMGGSLPNHQIQNEEDHDDNSRPEDGLLPKWHSRLVRYLSNAVNQADEFRLGLRLGHVTDHDGHDGANAPGPERAVHILGHVLRIGRECNVVAVSYTHLRAHE